MGPSTGNRKTKSPRPVLADPRAGRPATRRVYAASTPSPSPTPLPVVVAPRSSRPSATPIIEPRIPAPSTDRPLGRWALISVALLALFASAAAYRTLDVAAWVTPTLRRATGQLDGALRATPPPASAPATAKAPTRSRWHVKHDGYASISGGVLLTPESFVSSSGTYDLVIHFHGDVAIVRESFERAQINAAVAVINLGISSGAYRQAFTPPGSFGELLSQIQRALERRGYHRPKLHRLALTAWSAGAGAIKSILENRAAPRAEIDPLDAIVVLDGLHTGFVGGDPRRLKRRSVQSFLDAGRAAVRGDLMLSLTYSQIDPVRYASTERTAGYLLEQLGAAPHDSAVLPLPEHIMLHAALRAVKEHKRLIPISDTRLGSLHVQGFKGNTADDHAAHLTQMAAVVLPELAARWRHVEASAAGSH